MKSLVNLLMDLLWLAATAVLAWNFPITFLVIEIIAAGTTFALWKVEQSWA